jgi:hypothetical protein
MSACKSDQDRAGEAAMNFLDYELSGKKASAYELVSKEDQAAKPKSEYIESNALAESMRQALQDKVSHKLEDVSVDKKAGTATAVVEVTAPNIFKAALEDKEPDDMPMMTNERSIELVKEGDVWKVDTDWAEEKKKEEERQRQRELEAKADALVEEARALIPPDKLHEAKAKLEEALELKPDHQPARAELEGVEAQLAKLVAGHWRLEREVSEMTDEENAYTYLPSSNFDDAPFDQIERASLYVRCREGDFSVYFAFPDHVDLGLDDYRYGPRVRVRFDDEDAQRIRMSRSDSGDSLFARKSASFLKDLRKAERFLIEVPTYKGDKLWKFELDGADKALASVYKTCGKSM